nr:MAG TPA: hypothetical protein [Caudoviricetes sp.]
MELRTGNRFRLHVQGGETENNHCLTTSALNGDCTD